MKKISIFLLVIMFLFAGVSYAQPGAGNSSIESILINSKRLNEEREQTIYLPAGYAASDQKYPVLYLLDGRTHFKHAMGAADFLVNQGSAPGMIIVSIHNVDRSRDFSPVYHESVPTSGGGDKFLNFISEELIAHMDDHYRTSGFNILLGHSFGGTFIVHALLEKPDLFDAYIAVSPYLMFADNYVVEEVEKRLKPLKGANKFFYMTVGDEPNYFETLDRFSSLMKEKASGTVEFSYITMKAENHGTIPYITLFNGLRFIFSDWQLTPNTFQGGMEVIDAHYNKLSNRYGFKVETPELVINALGYNYLQAGDVEKSIPVFMENVKRYPGSANVYDSLGEAYENDGQIKLAGKNYKMAVDLGEKLGDPNLSVYKQNLERVDSGKE